MGLDEKSAVVLAQYDVSIRGYYRQKGAGFLETEQGLLMLRGREVKEGRAVWEEEVKKQIVAQGFSLVDIGVPNREGRYVTEGDYGETFLLRHWKQGEEMDLRLSEHRLRAVETLARLHRAMRGLPVRSEYIRESTKEIFEKRIREMRRLATYLYKRKQKNPFELKLLELLPVYLKKAEAALSCLLAGDWQQVHREAEEQGVGCHGNYGNHSLLLLDGGRVFVGNFEHAGIGPQAEDIYYLLRKSLEKNGWDEEIYTQMLSAYQKERPLPRQELRLLLCLLLFPEKFYRVCNQYFNARKAWIPAKNAQKLMLVLEQQEPKSRFDEKINKLLACPGLFML
ncbi:MAG: phosphotransferase [Lachnospiraceae bacterium]|nr:phosphotransferase [Lachnospiraceae bacterium]